MKECREINNYTYRTTSRKKGERDLKTEKLTEEMKERERERERERLQDQKQKGRKERQIEREREIPKVRKT